MRWSLLRFIKGRTWSPGRLARMVQSIHKGEISIEELSSAASSAGRWSPLMTAIADILVDLKQQQADRAVIEQGIRDRIANRTDALERRIGSLQVQAMRDPLTRLLNRRGLDAQLPKLIEQFLAGGCDACLLMIDIDHFKQLNDTLGHPVGDQLLREIGQLIRSSIAEEDQAFRTGGDEFVVLLHDSDLQQGMAIAEQLAALVSALTQTLPVPLPPQLSIGGCSMSELKTPTPELLLQTADNRLYAVKAARPRTRRSA